MGVEFQVRGGGTITVEPEHVIVAGYTGRDRHKVQEHIDELALIGVAPPPTVPMIYRLPSALLITRETITVTGSGSTGEVEPVLIRHSGSWYLGVGSDHTDRDMEREGVELSKAACPKPVGGEVIALEEAALEPGNDEAWGSGELSSRVDDVPYQSGTLAMMLPPREILAGIDEVGGPEDLVVFCGTVPLLGHGFVPGERFTAEIALPGRESLQLDYRIVVDGARGEGKEIDDDL